MNGLDKHIKDKIIKIRRVQAILDSDLAQLYEVETRVLKQAVKRNKSRFPNNFMFILTKEEINALVSQNVIPSKQVLGGAQPYAFTEQGVAMLSGVLKSKTAVNISIQIINAFVAMRHFISSYSQLFQRLNKVELKQIEQENKFDQIFKTIKQTNLPKKGIFYNGELFDAHKFISDIVRSANKSITLIDNYVDDTTLQLFTKCKKHIHINIYTKHISKQLEIDLKKFNEQYFTITIHEFTQSHDRFLIIDKETTYHIGASLKDVGKKWFAFSTFEKETIDFLQKLP